MGMLAAEAQDARRMNHSANLVLPVRSCLIRLVPIKLARTILLRRGLGLNGACDTQPGQKNLSWTGGKMIKERRLGSKGMPTPSELREVLQGW